MTNSRGDVVTIENAVCMHEEDSGILWKHVDWRTEQIEVRRSRRLVVSFIATVGNYEYGFFWYFYQDGTIQYEIKLTGIVNNPVQSVITLNGRRLLPNHHLFARQAQTFLLEDDVGDNHEPLGANVPYPYHE